MQSLRKYTPFFTSALLMYVALVIIYPHYQYYIDPDGIAYLTISKRYAAGDFQTAINGYWSPWSCWLTALLIKGGLQAMPASVIINTLGATGFLFISQSFFLRFSIVNMLQWLFNITLAFFLCYAIFWQSFDDLWECFFLLATLRIMIADGFASKPALWIASGALGAFAYFAKAYSFPFFILNTICCVYFICKDNKARWLQVSFVMIITMVFCSMPWLSALHNKYRMWTIGTAGSLNMSWYLVGHPNWEGGIDLLIPPFYKGSPSYWEDPYWANGATSHFWNSWHMFGLQILRIGLNAWKFLVSSVQLSVFFPFLVVFACFSLFHKKIKEFLQGPNQVMVISFLLFPLAYFLVNFESRYIWYMLPLGMVIGGRVLQALLGGKQYALFFLFSISFFFYPMWGLYKMYDVGKDDHRIGEQLKQLGIHGTFTSMGAPGYELQSMERIGYFSGNQFYALSRLEYTQKEVLREMRRYHIQYFFAYGSSPDIFNDENGKAFTDITHGEIHWLKIFLVDP